MTDADWATARKVSITLLGKLSVTALRDTAGKVSAEYTDKFEQGDIMSLGKTDLQAFLGNVEIEQRKAEESKREEDETGLNDLDTQARSVLS